MENPTDELFDAYIDNTLPPGERAGFEAALGTDDALRQALELHRSTRDVIEVAALKAALGRIHKEAATEFEASAIAAGTPKKSHVKPLYNFRSWHAIAAVLVLGLGITTWRMMSGGSDNALYSKYYTQDAGLPGMMGSSANYTLDDAMVDYKSGQYRDAIDKLSALRQKGIAGDTATYYLGMAYLGDKQFEAAGKTLQPLTQRANVFRPKAAWYEALTGLRLGNKAAAKEALEAIAADSTNLKAPAARALLSEWK